MRSDALSASTLAAWVGRPVRATSVDGGVVDAAIAHFEPPSTAVLLRLALQSGGMQRMSLASIGRLHPKEGVPRGRQKLDYAAVLKRAEITVVATRCSGSTVKIDLRIPPDGREVPVRSESDAVDALLGPLWQGRGWGG